MNERKTGATLKAQPGSWLHGSRVKRGSKVFYDKNAATFNGSSQHVCYGKQK